MVTRIPASAAAAPARKAAPRRAEPKSRLAGSASEPQSRLTGAGGEPKSRLSGAGAEPKSRLSGPAAESAARGAGAPSLGQQLSQALEGVLGSALTGQMGHIGDAIGSAVGQAVAGGIQLQGERMSRVDTAWLRMDSPGNLMMIVGVWILRPSVRVADVRQRVEERLLKFARFRQKVVEDAAGAVWVTDKKLDIRQMVVTETLPAARPAKAGKTPRGARHAAAAAAAPAGDQAALQARVAQLASEPLSRERPLWQFHVIEHYTDPQGRVGSALIARFHHCIADGIALISVMNSIVDGGQEPPARRRRARLDDAPQEWLADSVVKPLTHWTVKALDLAGDGTARTLQTLGNPQKGLAGSLDIARAGVQLATDLSAMALMPDDSPTALKGKTGPVKCVAWCPPIPLDDVKAVGKALNASVNDVLLSCVAGAIGGYLRDRGDDTRGKEIRAMVPVNLRPLEEAYKLGNRFGLAPLVLPIGVTHPLERVYEVRRRMNALKGSFQPLITFGLLSVAGLLVKPAQDAMLNLFARKTTAVMTNVPGPREKLRFCGATLDENMFWVPQSGDVGMGVSILSYGGGVQFGLITDRGLCPEPEQIIARFTPEFERLSTLTLMLPWGT